jgi:hypothetical protein
MKNRTIFASLLVLALLTASASEAEPVETKKNLLPSRAADSERLILADATPLSLSEMQSIRGGFIDPTGLIYNFAVNVRTALNGAEIFTRSIIVAPAGGSGHLEATTNANVLPQNVPNTLNVSMIGKGKGVSIVDSDGNRTTVLNQTANGSPASIVVNTSNNRNIAQSVDVTLTLRGLSSIAGYIKASAQTAIMQHMNMRSLGF